MTSCFARDETTDRSYPAHPNFASVKSHLPRLHELWLIARERCSPEPAPDSVQWRYTPCGVESSLRAATSRIHATKTI